MCGKRARDTAPKGSKSCWNWLRFHEWGTPVTYSSTSLSGWLGRRRLCLGGWAATDVVVCVAVPPPPRLQIENNVRHATTDKRKRGGSQVGGSQMYKMILHIVAIPRTHGGNTPPGAPQLIVPNSGEIQKKFSCWNQVLQRYKIEAGAHGGEAHHQGRAPSAAFSRAVYFCTDKHSPYVNTPRPRIFPCFIWTYPEN